MVVSSILKLLFVVDGNLFSQHVEQVEASSEVMYAVAGPLTSLAVKRWLVTSFPGDGIRSTKSAMAGLGDKWLIMRDCQMQLPCGWKTFLFVELSEGHDNVFASGVRAARILVIL